MLGLGLSITIGGVITPYYVVVANAFRDRVEADGGTVESMSCLKKDLKVLNPVKPTVYKGLLNYYSGAAAAYSLRLLDNTYTGDVISVRNASTGQSTDIGFANNELDVAALETFCNGADGYVTAWYDQSGNNKHMFQSDAASQPKIVSSGTVIKDGNNKPVVEFEETVGQWMEVETSIGLTVNFLLTAVVTPTTNTNTWGVLLNGETADNRIRLYQNNTGQVRLSGTIYNYVASLSIGSLNVLSFQRTNTTSLEAYTNGVQKLNTTLSSAWSQIINRLGANHADPPAADHFLSAKVSELIAWDDTTDRAGVETNINDFY